MPGGEVIDASRQVTSQKFNFPAGWRGYGPPYGEVIFLI